MNARCICSCETLAGRFVTKIIEVRDGVLNKITSPSPIMRFITNIRNLMVILNLRGGRFSSPCFGGDDEGGEIVVLFGGLTFGLFEY